jgi:flagellar L-ring protein precursor FlgH
MMMMMSLNPSPKAPVKPLHIGVTRPARPKNKPTAPPVTSNAAVKSMIRSIYGATFMRLPINLGAALNRCFLFVSVSFSIILLVSVAWFNQPSHAESLFKPLAIGLAAPALSTPRMLYSPPKPSQVGDIVTILIKEKTRRQTVSQVQVKKTQANGTNGPEAINSAIGDALDTAGLGGLSKFARIPTIPRVTTDNNLQSQANLNQSSEFTDMVSCQVVQVLPNGNLMVQGRKANLMAKERTDTYVTGIINPYFLDSQNQIESSKVANLQVMASGQGVMSRGQGDGLLSKIIQFFQ